MIGRLCGRIIEKSPPSMVLDVQGVGYEVLMPMTSFYNLPDLNEDTMIFTHLVIREDAHLLFGFVQKQERMLFRELIKTNGVGPKLALAILSAMSVSEFMSAIEQEELAKLIKIPGIGRKTAERLLVELKGKFSTLFHHEISILQPSGNLLSMASMSPVNEAIDALISLGYKAADAEKMVKKVNRKSESTSEQLIREALKNAL
ncbi:Holliday junction branch migration protein RuvA [Glaesserella parasuis]|nr:Holliday junction branch migration protein RuvA [Glaesserella parasuis]EQA00810.1 Holliday junction DNA helicase RuvA [Glaesserella parasuis MN-H]EQA01984.1 holliday junction DNA helicase RuvA [Glaesserella parasuis SW114]EQA14528.1 holliday junction DNA helicase RuvA [Glaesserella parasuis 174]AIK17615.1 Holliday junction ATP-dependent DNA helicase RuvA [Glaesserella parasuis]AMW16424.1 Holliday junction DNA helicase RuvA [Glaesserella parasuis]